MKKICFFLFLLFFFNFKLFAISYSPEPKLFVSELVEDAIQILSDKSKSKEEKSEYIAKIALNNVDIKALSLYTLGDIRKTLDKEILLKYQTVFEKYFLKSLTSRLTDYSENKIEVIGSDQKSAKYTIVNSKISESPTQPEIKIDWRIYTKDPEKPLIRDLIVEGLSLARTQKEEFASVLNSNKNDINSLITKLQEFIAE